MRRKTKPKYTHTYIWWQLIKFDASVSNVMRKTVLQRTISENIRRRKTYEKAMTMKHRVLNDPMSRPKMVDIVNKGSFFLFLLCLQKMNRIYSCSFMPKKTIAGTIQVIKPFGSDKEKTKDSITRGKHQRE